LTYIGNKDIFNAKRCEYRLGETIGNYGGLMFFLAVDGA